jgi:hypothetical protein
MLLAPAALPMSSASTAPVTAFIAAGNAIETPQPAIIIAGIMVM